MKLLITLIIAIGLKCVCAESLENIIVECHAKKYLVKIPSNYLDTIMHTGHGHYQLFYWPNFDGLIIGCNAMTAPLFSDSISYKIEKEYYYQDKKIVLGIDINTGMVWGKMKIKNHYPEFVFYSSANRAYLFERILKEITFQKRISRD